MTKNACLEYETLSIYVVQYQNSLNSVNFKFHYTSCHILYATFRSMKSTIMQETILWKTVLVQHICILCQMIFKMLLTLGYLQLLKWDKMYYSRVNKNI